MRFQALSSATLAVALTAFCLAGCTDGAASPGDGQTEGSGGGAKTSVGSGGGGGSASTCTESTDLESDPGNCGRCGRACDDGVCTHGMCAPRVEVASGQGNPILEPYSIAVVDTRLFVLGTGDGYTRHLVRVDGGLTELDGNNLGFEESDDGEEMLTSDGTSVFAVAKSGIAQYDAEGTRIADISLPVYTSQIHAEANRIAAVKYVGWAGVVEEDRTVTEYTSLGGPDYERPRLSNGEFFVIRDTDLVKAAAPGFEVVAQAPIGIWETLVIDGDHIYTSYGADVIFGFSRAGEPTVEDHLPEDRRVELLAFGGQPPAAKFGSQRGRLVHRDGTVYLPVPMIPYVEPGSLDVPKVRAFILTWSAERGFRGFYTPSYSIEKDYDIASSALLAAGDRLYWLEADAASWRVLSAPL